MSRRGLRTQKLLITLSLIGALASRASAAQRPVCNGTVSVEVLVRGPESGVYTYALGAFWNSILGQSSLLLLSDCDPCQPELFTFGSPAGSMNGYYPYGGGCRIYYDGALRCAGDPSIPTEFLVPAVSLTRSPSSPYCLFTYPAWGSWQFKTPLPPGPNVVHPNAFVIKYGYNGEYCTGDVIGRLPLCGGPIGVDSGSWGRVKALFQ